MKNKIAKIFKVIAIVIFSLGFIAGIFYGMLEENIILFFMICIMSFIQGIVFFAVAEIIEQLDYANSINRGIYNILERIERKVSGISAGQSAVNAFVSQEIKNPADDNAESFTWNCPQCGNMNLSTSLFCKMCGHSKPHTYS